MPNTTKQTQIRYKFLREGLKSDSGDMTWKIGEWQKQKGKIETCENGLHCSKEVWQAFGYVQGEILAKVEVKGKSDIQDDKEAWSDMRIIKAWKWQKKDSVALAIYAAELVIDIFEEEYPDDDRPRQVIEAAKKWLKEPNRKNMAAAGAAGAAWAAGAAGAAAGAAAWAARAAAGAAGAAAGAAAWAARDAAWAARAARDAAGAAALIRKIDKWMTDRIKKLEEIKR